MTQEIDPVSWCLAHRNQAILVKIFCPTSYQPHLVAEVQAAPGNTLLKVFQRDTRPRDGSAPSGLPDDLSRRLASPAVQYLEAERRARKQFLKGRREVPAWDRKWPNSFQVYVVKGLPDEWERTMVCRCGQSLLTGAIVNEALSRSRHTGKAVVTRAHHGTC